MKRNIVYWGATGLVAIVALGRRQQLSGRRPPGGREFPARGIPAAIACLARPREAGRRDRAAPASAASIEGMGVRRVYLHVDRGNRGALSGGRREVVVAGGFARAAGGFVHHTLGGSPVREGRPGGDGSTLDSCLTPGRGSAARQLGQVRRRGRGRRLGSNCFGFPLP
jgi:hypothetical protein